MCGIITTSPSPHESWARFYDAVMEQTFGEEYRTFTEHTLEVVRSVATPPSSIVDFGAGTGRLAIPLAREGYRVTAVDPSGEMLAALRRGAGELPIETVASRMEDYRSDQRYDLALCVFTVLVYMLDETALTAAIAASATALRRGGVLLVDLPTESVFEGFELETEEVIRCVEIEPVGNSIYRYHERTAVMTDGGPVSYEDEFHIRHWKPDEIRLALERAGLRVGRDVSGCFEPWGADYLLCGR